MIVNGFVDWAERIRGHPDKVYSTPNTGEWITCHSVVSDLPNHSIPDRFLSNERLPDGRFTANAAASVMFILYKDGHLVQMYPVTASTWTSGGPQANTRSWAIEAEGGANPTNEPLTPAACATFVRLVREWEAYTGRKAFPDATLKQHKDVAHTFGYAATACASDRYAAAWALTQVQEEDMTEAQTRAIAKEEAAKVFDENFGAYFLAVTRAYWLPIGAGDFSNAPDREVVAAIKEAVK